MKLDWAAFAVQDQITTNQQMFRRLEHREKSNRDIRRSASCHGVLGEVADRR